MLLCFAPMSFVTSFCGVWTSWGFLKDRIPSLLGEKWLCSDTWCHQTSSLLMTRHGLQLTLIPSSKPCPSMRGFWSFPREAEFRFGAEKDPHSLWNITLGSQSWEPLLNQAPKVSSHLCFFLLTLLPTHPRLYVAFWGSTCGQPGVSLNCFVMMDWRFGVWEWE